MKIQACVVILLSLAWSIMASSPLGVETEENHRHAATTNIVNAFKKSDSRKTPGEFDSFRQKSRKARLNAPSQLQKNEGDRVKANVLKLQDQTSSVKTDGPNPPRMSNKVIVRNVNTPTDQLMAANEDLRSIGDEQFLPLEANKAPELTANIDNITNCAIEDRDIPCQCILELDEGSGNIRGFRWYYSRSLGWCERFQYGGHGGNDNNFKTAKECKDTCKVRRGPSKCYQGYMAGPGTVWTTRYWYNAQKNQCGEIKYGGIGGTDNNFETLKECEDTCEVARSNYGSRFDSDIWR